MYQVWCCVHCHWEAIVSYVIRHINIIATNSCSSLAFVVVTEPKFHSYSVTTQTAEHHQVEGRTEVVLSHCVSFETKRKLCVFAGLSTTCWKRQSEKVVEGIGEEEWCADRMDRCQMGRVEYLRHGRWKMHGWFLVKDKLKEISFYKLEGFPKLKESLNVTYLKL